NARSATSLNPPKIDTMENSKTPVRSLGLLRFVAAASVVLLLGMAWLYYQTKQQNADLVNTKDRLQVSWDSRRSILDKIVQEQKQVVGDPNTTVVNMVGTKVAPKSSANVYWDSA